QKAPDRRYASAAALAEDLRRYRQGEPIPARPTSRTERGGRWGRLPPGMGALTATVALLLLTLTLGTSGAALGLRPQLHLSEKAEQQARQAEQQAREAEQQAKHRLYEARLAQAKASRWSGQAGRRFASLDALAEAARLLGPLEPGSKA